MLKSKIILAPAGSGKTETLAKRYIELLQYTEPERILTITFTEKAAAEMKERIFNILKQTDQDKYHLVKEKSLRLRIQTIDSFCFSLLRRFAHLISYQENLEVLTDSDYLKELAIANTMFKIAEQEIDSADYHTLIKLIVTQSFQGWKVLRNLFDLLYQARLSPQRAKLPPVPGLENLPDLIAHLAQHPITKERLRDFQFTLPKTSQEAEELKAKITEIEDIFLTTAKKPRSQGLSPPAVEWNKKMAEYRRIIFNLTSIFRFQHTFQLFTNRFLKEFNEMKRSLNQVDFADLENLTYHILTTHPEWANILYLFDEQTDHILVDEFQDTSFLQWAIIAKLAEEFVSGQGAKHSRGIKVTIFLVGDDKQSIYLFRNAHPEIFSRAKQYLARNLPPQEFEYQQVRENYRSLKGIIDFTNHLFAKIMNPAENSPGWMSRYGPFECQRKNANPGIVEIILAPLKGNASQARAKDAELVAKKILTIINQPIVYDQNEEPRQVTYEDIAILLRNRTYLNYYEDALRKYQIPFIVLKGGGFYDTIEITYLRSILNFLVDPNDNLSLYLLLKSPVFGLPEKKILTISQSNQKISLWQRLILSSSQNPYLQPTIANLKKYLSMVMQKPLSLIIENFLAEFQLYKLFWQTQQSLNIAKFLRIIQVLEQQGLSPFSIANYFEKSLRKDEPKANVSTQGRNEVKVMTIHSAKGLQFPIVFLAGIDQPFKVKGYPEDILVVSEVDEDNVYVLYEPDPDLRNQSDVFQEKIAQELEQEKRIFYVALTRARDAIFLTGIDNPENPHRPGNSYLNYLKQHLPISFDEHRQLYFTPTKIEGLSILTEQQLSANFQATLRTTDPVKVRPAVKEYLQKLTPDKVLNWQAVTKEIPEIYHRLWQNNGEDWIILGEVLHQIFEKIANAKIEFEHFAIIDQAVRLFNTLNVPPAKQKAMLKEIDRQYHLIAQSPISEIIRPQPNSYAELRFVLKAGMTAYTGRIDRIIIRDNQIYLYDYKTFPIKRHEISELLQKYQRQMAIYKQGAQRIFNIAKVYGYLVWTAQGIVTPI